MKRMMVRYRVRPECVADNESAIRDVFAALATYEATGFHYASFKLDDGVSFMHVVAVDEGGSEPLRELPAFQAFVAGVRERCDQPPVTTALETVGSYRVFD